MNNFFGETENVLMLDERVSSREVIPLVKKGGMNFIVADESNEINDKVLAHLIKQKYEVFKIKNIDDIDKLIDEAISVMLQKKKFIIVVEADNKLSRQLNAEFMSDAVDMLWEVILNISKDKISPNHIKFILNTRSSQHPFYKIRTMVSKSKELNTSIVLFENSLSQFASKYKYVYEMLLVDVDTTYMPREYKHKDVRKLYETMVDNVLKSRKEKELYRPEALALERRKLTNDMIKVYENDNGKYITRKIKLKK